MSGHVVAQYPIRLPADHDMQVIRERVRGTVFEVLHVSQPQAWS